MDQDRHILIATALTEAQRMQSAVAGAAADAHVSMAADQFSRLAELLAMLAQAQPDSDADEDLSPMDQLGTWVPLKYLEMAKAEAEKWKAEYVRLSASGQGPDYFRF